MIYAIVNINGIQTRVAPDEVLSVARTSGAPGDMLTFDQVLMVADGEKIAIGQPYLGMWPTFGWRTPQTFWFVHPVLASGVDFVLIAAPAVAIAAFVRPRMQRAAPSPDGCTMSAPSEVAP